MKIWEWLAYAKARLESSGNRSAMLEAQMLLANRLKVSRSWVLAHMDMLVTKDLFEEDLKRREKHEPLAYILGWREFYGRKFKVRPGVLIPRHETEVLIDAAKEILPLGTMAKVLDIGTGSGCIPITLKLENPSLDVSALDNSQIALEVAEGNAQELKADIQFLLSDTVGSLKASEKFDLVISNPPYIAQGYPLEPEVELYEPSPALYAGKEGLDFYERLALEVPAHLKSGGSLLLEIGFDQYEAVISLFTDSGWSFVRPWRDLSGVERVVQFQR